MENNRTLLGFERMLIDRAITHPEWLDDADKFIISIIPRDSVLKYLGLEKIYEPCFDDSFN